MFGKFTKLIQSNMPEVSIFSNSNLFVNISNIPNPKQVPNKLIFIINFQIQLFL